MKKLTAMLLALAMVLAFAGCAKTEAPATEAPTTEAPVVETEAATEAPVVETEAAAAVMTHEEYMAAELDAEVTVETYVQAGESWWDGKVALYCQSPDGALYLYGMSCTEEEAAKLVPGTKVVATGVKAEWNGEVEVMDGTVAVVEGGDTFLAEAADLTSLVGADELASHMNELAAFKGLTVAPSIDAEGKEVGFLYNWDGSGAQGESDVYFNLTDGTTTITCTVNRYMLGTGADSDVYKAAEALKVGDKVDVEGFLYWYNAVQPHVTALTVVE